MSNEFLRKVIVVVGKSKHGFMRTVYSIFSVPWGTLTFLVNVLVFEERATGVISEQPNCWAKSSFHSRGGTRCNGVVNGNSYMWRRDR